MDLKINSRPLRVQYYIRIPNVGDRLSPEIVSAVGGAPASYYHGRAQHHLIAGGTNMAGARSSSHIWGSGAMATNKIGRPLSQNIYAVRGKLTYQALKSAGLLYGDIPLGDPAYLAPALLGVSKSSQPKYRLGIVPHYTDNRNPHIKRMTSMEGVAHLNVHDAPADFLRKLSQCATVASSSLHGLILAEALGIPNVWIKAGGEIGGGSFRFDDWFSTTVSPQKQPIIVDPQTDENDLISAARPHEPSFDATELAAAFPHQKMAMLRSSVARRCYPVSVCRSRPTPVFLISFNRGDFLQRTISDIKSLASPTEIIVHDNGSSDSATMSTLDRLEKGGIKVYRRAPISSAEELNKVDETVSDYFRTWDEPQNYVVSDCDISLGCADKNTLEVYHSLLEQFPSVESVGPMLRISDIPRTYPLYVAVMNRHIGAFWQKEPQWATVPQGSVAYQHARIDTTFALHRAGVPFRRLKPSIRVYHPYEARHLDWYVGEEATAYALSSHPDVANWGNRKKLDAVRGRKGPLKHDWYYVVVSDPEPRVKRISLN